MSAPAAPRYTVVGAVPIGSAVPWGARDVVATVSTWGPSPNECPGCRLGTDTFVLDGTLYEQPRHYVGCPDAPEGMT